MKTEHSPVTYAVVWKRRSLRCRGTAPQVAPAQQEGRAAPGCLTGQWRATFSEKCRRGSVRACWGNLVEGGAKTCTFPALKPLIVSSSSSNKRNDRWLFFTCVASRCECCFADAPHFLQHTRQKLIS